MVESLPNTDKNNSLTHRLPEFLKGAKRVGLSFLAASGIYVSSVGESSAQTTISCQLYNNGEIRCPNVNNYQQPQNYQDSGCPSSRYFRRNDGSFVCDSNVSYPNQYPTVTYNPDYINFQPATTVTTGRSLTRSSTRTLLRETRNGIPVRSLFTESDQISESFTQIFGPGVTVRYR